MSQDPLNYDFRHADGEINQKNKKLVLEFFSDLEKAPLDDLTNVMNTYTSSDYVWHGVYPFEEQRGAEAVVETFWQPLFSAWEHVQRRQMLFIAGESVFGGNWVASMGHFLGMFERDWLGIPATGKMAFLRYCEFHRIEESKLAETYFHTDLISVMKQAGVDPLPPQTGAEFVFPGPRTSDGILLEAQDPAESAKTLALIQRMANGLGRTSRGRHEPPKTCRDLARRHGLVRSQRHRLDDGH